MNKCLIVAVLLACSAHGAVVRSWHFDDVAEGKLPDHWKVEATGQDKTTATWAVANKDDAPLGPGVLDLSATNHMTQGVFNLCWTNEVKFREGRIAVFLRARSGRIDQGGGLIWRVQDRNNYYIARYNPLEENVSIYYVKDGSRTMLGYTGKLVVKDGWHVLMIRHEGQRIRAYLDGEMRLMVNGGDYITRPGGVGLWTKADAATSFDDFTVVAR